MHMIVAIGNIFAGSQVKEVQVSFPLTSWVNKYMRNKKYFIVSLENLVLYFDHELTYYL